MPISSITSNNLPTLRVSQQQNAPAKQPFLDRLLTWVNADFHEILGQQRDMAASRMLEAYQRQSNRLSLSGLNLISLPEDAFADLKNLQILDLSFNKFASLPETLFAGLTNLKRLDLDKNQLLTLPEGIFTGLTKLEHLHLNYNELSALPEKVFAELASLKKLHLYYNQLNNLPEKVFAGLTNLETLELSHNQLSTLPEKSFDRSTNLKNLCLYANRLNNLPEKIFSALTNLKDLNLNENHINTLSEKIFAELANLKTLGLSFNRLTALPENIFAALVNLHNLSLYQNRLNSLPEKVFEKLINLKNLNLVSNPFIFKPNIEIPNDCTVAIEPNLSTLREEFQKGNQNLLSFNLDDIPGMVDTKGLLKLKIMLEHASEKIDANKRFAWDHSSTLNQLIYQASILSKEDPQNQAPTQQAQFLLAKYLAVENIKQFAEQANEICFDPSRYEGFVFITEDGRQGLTIGKDCYEVNILNTPLANRNAPNAAPANGILIHGINQQADTLRSPDELKPFALINQAYMKILNKQGLDTLLTSMNMGDEYKQRFTDALTVGSIGILARNRGTSAEERVNLAPYKMVNHKESAQLFEIFSQLVNEQTNSAVDRLTTPTATITDEHFASICKAFPSISEQEHAALMFVLSILFARYSSQAFFGTEDDSPIALRFYTSALLNKLKTLDQNLFIQVDGENLQRLLFEDVCTDILSTHMQKIATNEPAVRSIYQQVMPQMWQ